MVQRLFGANPFLNPFKIDLDKLPGINDGNIKKGLTPSSINPEMAIPTTTITPRPSYKSNIEHFRRVLSSPITAKDPFTGLIQGIHRVYAGHALGRAEREKAERDAADKQRNQELIRSVLSGEGTLRDKIAQNPGIVDNPNFLNFLFKLEEKPERKIIKDAAGRQRYQDTGEYVFGDVEVQPEYDEVTGRQGNIWRRPKGSTQPYKNTGQRDPSFKPDRADAKFKDWSWNNKTGQYERTNPQTGALEVKQADKPPPEEEPLSFDEKIKFAQSLSKETAQLAGDTLDIQKSYLDGLNGANQQTQAGDYALIFAFNKMLDAGSIVREGEVKAVLGLQNVEGGIISYFKKMISDNGQITPQLKQNLLAVMKDGFISSVRNYDIIHNQQLAKAERYGIDPQNITDLINREVYENAINKGKEEKPTTITGRTLGETVNQAQDVSEGVTPEQTLQSTPSSIEVIDREGNSHYAIYSKDEVYNLEPDSLNSYHDSVMKTFFNAEDGREKFEKLDPEEQNRLIWFQRFYANVVDRLNRLKGN